MRLVLFFFQSILCLMLVAPATLNAQNNNNKQQEQALISRVDRIPQMHIARQKDSVLFARAALSEFYRKHKQWDKYFWQRCCYYTEELLYDKWPLIDSAGIALLPDSVKKYCRKNKALILTARSTWFDYQLYKKLSKTPVAYLREHQQMALANIRSDSAAWIEITYMLSDWHALNSQFDSSLYYLKTIPLAQAQKCEKRLRPGRRHENIIKSMCVVLDRKNDFGNAYHYRKILINTYLEKGDTIDALRQYFQTTSMLMDKAYDYELAFQTLSAFEKLLQLKPETEHQAKYHLLMGRYFYHMADYTKSVIQLRAAADHASLLKNKEVKALVGKDMARTFDKLNMPDSALTAYRIFYEYNFARSLDPERKEINKDVNLINFLIKARQIDELKQRQEPLQAKINLTKDTDERLIGLYNLLQIKEAVADTSNIALIIGEMLELWQKSSKKAPWVSGNAYLAIAHLLSKWLLENEKPETARKQTEYIDKQYQNRLFSRQSTLGASQIILYQKNQLTKAALMLKSNESNMAELNRWLDDKNRLDSLIFLHSVQLFNIRDQSIILEYQSALKAVALELCYHYYLHTNNSETLKRHFLQHISRGYGSLLNYQREERERKRNAGVSDSVIAKEATLRNRLNALAGENNLAQFQKQLLELEAFYRNTGLSSHSFSEKMHAALSQSSATKVAEDEMKLFLFPTDKGVYSASVSAKGIYIHFLNDNQWQAKLNAFRKNIIRLSNNVQKDGEHIYRMLLKPHLDGANSKIRIARLKIAAAGMLSAFPYSALVCKDAASNKLKYLAERYHISLHYDFAEETSNDDNQHQTINFQLIAPFIENKANADLHLPHSAQEVYVISQQLRKIKANVWLHAGTVSAFHTPEIKKQENLHLHFSTHAGTQEHNPDSSYILLIDNSQKPSKLYATDIYALGIKPNTVFLSACESGKGKYLSNEGLIGISRAFFFLNTKTVIASLWKVSDASTARLSQYYYEHYLQHRKPAAALAHAQAALVKDPKFNHPFYWSAFMVFQNGD